MVPLSHAHTCQTFATGNLTRTHIRFHTCTNLLFLSAISSHERRHLSIFPSLRFAIRFCYHHHHLFDLIRAESLALISLE
ncbi:hypothetical protein Bca101_011738 [Brassica carinata]